MPRRPTEDIALFDPDLGAVLDWVMVAVEALARSDVVTALDAIACARKIIERKAGVG